MILFNSWSYIFFLIIVVAFYWRLNLRFQNLFLLFASLLFYATWDWRFLFILFLSSFTDYIAAIGIETAQSQKGKKIWLWISVGFNLLILGIFKYCSFFVESFVQLLSRFDINPPLPIIKVMLPIGISFYTFKAIGYVIEVYRGNIKATRDFPNYMLFVAFFPLLIAGPIERAKNLLPQITQTRSFSWVQVWEAIDLILWGLIKKMIVADNIAYYVQILFTMKDPSTILILLASFAFGIQLLADFSGYTDIARGSSKLLGFKIMENFRLPYLARNPSEFWSRWHISLSSYIKDYVYIPLGGSRCSKFRYLINIFLTWFLMGLWHGASWNFIAWGLYHGVLVAGHKLLFEGKQIFNWINQNIRMWAAIAITYILVNLGWILFCTNRVLRIKDFFNLKALLLSPLDLRVSSILGLIILFYSIPVFLGLIWGAVRIKTAPDWMPSLRIFYYTSGLLALLIFSGVKYSFVYFQF